MICGISLTRSLFTNNKAISFIEQASDSDGFPRLADTVVTVFPLTAVQAVFTGTLQGLTCEKKAESILVKAANLYSE